MYKRIFIHSPLSDGRSSPLCLLYVPETWSCNLHLMESTWSCKGTSGPFVYGRILLLLYAILSFRMPLIFILTLKYRTLTCWGYEQLIMFSTPPVPSLIRDILLIAALRTTTTNLPMAFYATKNFVVSRLIEVRQVHRRHCLDRDAAFDEVESLKKENDKMRENTPWLGERFRFYQDLRGYVTDLVDCLDEKVGLLLFQTWEGITLISQASNVSKPNSFSLHQCSAEW